MAIKFKKKFEISDKILQKALDLEVNNIKLKEVCTVILIIYTTIVKYSH